MRITASATASPVGNKNDMACTVYYRTRGAEAWATAQNLIPLSYSIGVTNALLPQTFDVLSSYELKIRVTDTFYYVEQSVEIGTKQVMIDLYQDGTGIAFGKVAETPGAVEFGWPVKLVEPLEVTQGGTGANNGASACANIGAVQKSGDAMTGNLQISGRLYPSLYLLPTYNDTTNRVVFEGIYSGAGSFSAWEDSSGTNRRMLEVRTAKYKASKDDAVVLRCVENGSYYSYRVFHAGMATPVPIANGGTGASTAKAALTNLGVFYAETLPDTGEDGQICLVPV